MRNTEIADRYTPQQIADQLGYKVASIYALISRGELSASKSGRSRYISNQQVQNFLHKRKNARTVIDYTK